MPVRTATKFLVSLPPIGRRQGSKDDCHDRRLDGLHGEGARILHVIAWLVSVAACIASLRLSSRYSAGMVLTYAVGAIVGGMLLVTMIGLGLHELQIKPPHAVLAVMMQLLMTVCTGALCNIMNLASRGMVNGQGAFHKRYNAKNLHRFPVNFVVGEASRIRTFATVFWSIGSVTIFYGIWLKMTF